MTLRLPFYLQQPLFVVACVLWVAAGAARAQDTIITLSGGLAAPTVGKIVGASASGVQILIGGNSITLPMGQIKEVRMAVIPPEFAAAQKAVEAKNWDSALTLLKSLEKYKGLPMDWAQQATAFLGDVYVEKGDLARAEAAYRDFQKLYPSGQGNAQSEIGLARLAVAKKDYATAKNKVEPILAKAGEDKNVNRSSGYAYSQACYLMGQIKESEGDLAAALENYLKTVTIFYYDRTAALSAQEKADALRQANPTIFIP